MKQIVLYTVALGIMLGSLMTNHDVERLPFLISHYRQHEEKNPISFLEFLRMHYGESSPDDNEHEALPFKHTDCTAAHILVFLPPILPLPPALSEQLCQPATPVFFQSPSNISSSIWQPPRLG